VTISRISVAFVAGVLIGGTVMTLVGFYLAQRASPVWTGEEEVRALYRLEREVKESFRKGDLDEALLKIRAASVFRELRSQPESYSEWPYVFPTVALSLSIAGVEPQRFLGAGKTDNTLALYACVEIFLLSEQKAVVSANQRLERLRAARPGVNEASCREIARGFLS
jgi:hypothetical protein